MRGPSIVVSRLLLVAIALVAALSAQAPSTVRRTSNPHGPLKVACESCHTSNAWKPIRPQPEFDHNSQTKWPLLGLHEGVACSSCHVNRVFKNVSKACASCHADIHRRQFGANCQQCHTVKGWRVAVQQTREHNNRFPLLGAHSAAPCESCHKNAAVGQFQGLSTECMACHTPNYNRTKDHSARWRRCARPAIRGVGPGPATGTAAGPPQRIELYPAEEPWRRREIPRKRWRAHTERASS